MRMTERVRGNKTPTKPRSAAERRRSTTVRPQRGAAEAKERRWARLRTSMRASREGASTKGLPKACTRAARQMLCWTATPRCCRRTGPRCRSWRTWMRASTRQVRACWARCCGKARPCCRSWRTWMRVSARQLRACWARLIGVASSVFSIDCSRTDAEKLRLNFSSARCTMTLRSSRSSTESLGRAPPASGARPCARHSLTCCSSRCRPCRGRYFAASCVRRLGTADPRSMRCCSTLVRIRHSIRRGGRTTPTCCWRLS
mmetsp:Transcript_102478/g.293992  ORF Transcript_102478/g.293992 Transcript_102478/m.293992 type:complete len:259 (-) Transcript_102478:595-1371(-)